MPGAVDTPIYRHAADYIGRDIRSLPQVTSAERVVSAIVRAGDQPKARVVVGQTQRLGVWAHYFAPQLYDRLVVPIVHTAALRSTRTKKHDGNVFTPDPRINSVADGRRSHDHRRIVQVITGTAVTAAAVAVAGLTRRPVRGWRGRGWPSGAGSRANQRT